jgi:hypothetical protein
MEDELFPEQVGMNRHSKNSAADAIAEMLVELGAARQAAVSVIALDLYSRELAKLPIEAVKAAIHSLSLAKRRDFEPAFPDLPTLLEAVEAEERKRNPGRFVSCDKCTNGIVFRIIKGEQFAGHCECFETWKQARAAARVT